MKGMFACLRIFAFLTLTVGINTYAGAQTEVPQPTAEPYYFPYASDDIVSIDTDEGDFPKIPGCLIITIEADGCYIPSDFDYNVLVDECEADFLNEKIKVGSTCDGGNFSSTAHDCTALCFGGTCETTTVQGCNYPAGTGTSVGYCSCPGSSMEPAPY